MKKQTIKLSSGFSALEAILIVVIIGLAGTLGYVFWQKSHNTSDTDQAQHTNESTPHPSKKNSSLPDGWKTYTDETHGFSIAYDGEFTPKTELYTLAPDDHALSDQASILSFAKQSIPADDLAPLSIVISDQTAAQAIEWRENVIARNNARPDAATLTEVTSKKSIDIDGYPATRIDTKDAPRAPIAEDAYGDPSYSTRVYMQIKHKTYTISTTSFAKDSFNSASAQTMLTSLKLPKSK